MPADLGGALPSAGKEAGVGQPSPQVLGRLPGARPPRTPPRHACDESDIVRTPWQRAPAGNDGEAIHLDPHFSSASAPARRGCGSPLTIPARLRRHSSTARARRRLPLSVIPIGRRRPPTQGRKRGGPATTRIRIIATSRTTGAAKVLSGPSRCGSSPSRRDLPAGASCSVAVNACDEWGRTKLVRPLVGRARLLSPASTASLAVCSVAGFRP